MSATAPTIRDRVVIVGCGFGGLFAARTLGHADVDVTIGRTNHHLSQALLYQGNTSVVVGEVLDIDVEARRLTIDRLGQCDSIPYDSLIVATGATQSYFGHPEFQHNAPGLKSPALPLGCSGLRSHLSRLGGFGNRLAVLYDWTVAFVGSGHAQRVITAQQVFGRRALEAQPPDSTGARLECAA